MAQAYLAAVLVVAFASAICFLISPSAGGKYQLFVYLAAALVTAWVFGSGPGLAALMGGYVAGDCFFVEPLHSLVPKGESEFISLTAYLITGFLSLFGVSALRHYIRTSLTVQKEALELER